MQTQEFKKLKLKDKFKYYSKAFKLINNTVINSYENENELEFFFNINKGVNEFAVIKYGELIFEYEYISLHYNDIINQYDIMITSDGVSYLTPPNLEEKRLLKKALIYKHKEMNYNFMIDNSIEKLKILNIFDEINQETELI